MTSYASGPDRSDITIRAAVEADWEAAHRVSSVAFNEEGDDASSAVERLVFEPERTLLAEREGAIVGTAAISTRLMCVPGALVPTAHVTFVAVAPTARRQGILTQFMRRQFADGLAAGEPIAALWASEGRIYQRYGFAMAARRVGYSIESREVEVTDQTSVNSDTRADGRLRESTPAESRETLHAIYDRVYPSRPGWSERDDRHWDYRLADPESSRRGATPLRVMVHDGPSGPDGYALWRVNGKWAESGPAGEVRVRELVAQNPAAYVALWRLLLSLDLTRTVESWACAVDEPLQFLVTEPRRLVARMADSLWVRILDLPTALQARRYAAPVDLVFEVTDELVPANAGRWRLTGSPDSASCVSTVEPADLSCDIRALASAYLGDQRLGALGLAGLIQEHRAGALAAASTAFGWHIAPSSLEVF